MRRVYLAVPYRGMEERAFEAVTDLAARLVKSGLAVYSPITHSHPIVLADRNIHGHFDFWAEMDYSFITLWATEVVVLKLPGWERSAGVRKETEYAKMLGLPVHYVEPGGEVLP